MAVLFGFPLQAWQVHRTKKRHTRVTALRHMHIFQHLQMPSHFIGDFPASSSLSDTEGSDLIRHVPWHAQTVTQLGRLPKHAVGANRENILGLNCDIKTLGHPNNYACRPFEHQSIPHRVDAWLDSICLDFWKKAPKSSVAVKFSKTASSPAQPVHPVQPHRTRSLLSQKLGGHGKTMKNLHPVQFISNGQALM